MKAAVVVLLLVLLAAPVVAQDLAPKAKAQEKPVTIEGATTHPISGPPIENGKLSFRDGRIVDAASDESVVVDGKGLHVYPGLVAPWTELGLTEIGAVRATRDAEETGSIRPEVRAITAVNPDSTLFPVARSNGILTAGTFPRGPGIAGRGAVLRLDGWTNDDMALMTEAGLVVAWPSPKPRRRWWMKETDEQLKEKAQKNLVRIKESFAQARAYGKARAADPKMPVDLRWEAMQAAFAGRPVFFVANDYTQITGAVRFAAKEKLRAVIVGGRDAHLCLPLLKKHDVAVIVTGVWRLPKRRDSDVNESYLLPAILERAGVRWCLGSGQPASNERNLSYAAAAAVRNGLSEEAALRAITLSAAEITGVGKELGSLEPGKRATLIVTTGSPLEMTTKIEMAFIDGRRIDLSNKQTKLAEKYREKYRQLGIKR